MKHLKPELQNKFLEQLLAEYRYTHTHTHTHVSFFKFRDELKPFLEKCASFWSQDGANFSTLQVFTHTRHTHPHTRLLFDHLEK